LRNENVLVTGGAGFIGSHLVRLLLDVYPQARVVSLDNYFTGSRENHVESDRVVYLEGATSDVRRIWRESHLPAPDAVFHLGEYSRVVQSFEDRELVWESNLRGTKEVVEFAHRHGSKLVYAGSSTRFGNDGEDQHLNPYAWTKAKNVEYIKNFSSWFGLDHAIAYFYNVYGPGHIKDGKYATVIGIFEREFESGEPLTVVAPGTQTRDFTHVADIVAGLVLCRERGAGDGYLLGTGREWQILEVAKLFGADYVLVPPLPGERTSGRADTSKARSIGWTPERDLADYIAGFVAGGVRAHS
jgi:UDP-glucose 4-epimerase